MVTGVSVSTIPGSTGNSTVSLNVSQVGGAGGDGINGASGGQGASSTLSATLRGFTTGIFNFNQAATGGNGGNSDTGAVGAGGNSSSTLVLDQTLLPAGQQASVLNGLATATGGNGGTGGNGSNAAGATGGTATASINLTSNNAVFATANAVGGAAGTGGSAPTAGGAANATATGTGSSGLVTATAFTPGTGPVFAVGANANANIASTLVVNANTSIGGNTPALPSSFTTAGSATGYGSGGLIPNGANAFAIGTGLPTVASVSAVLNGTLNGKGALTSNTNVWAQQASFVAGAGLLGAVFPANGTLGVEHDINTQLDYTFSVPSGKGTTLTIGLLNGTIFNGLAGEFANAGDKLTFSVTDNLASIYSQTFTTLAAAEAFFTDDVLTLGTFTGTNDIGINLDLVAFDDVGFSGNFLVGTSGTAGGGGGGAGVPEPSTIAVFFTALLGWAGINRKRQQKKAQGMPAAA